MKFRLTYQGTLLVGNDSGRIQGARANHKHEIRKAFHRQLKRLWEVHPFLSQGLGNQEADERAIVLGRPPNEHSAGVLSEKFQVNNHRFVPLVTKESGILCSVDVLFLRSDPPGSVIRSGDIDNRLKTLFDGLTMPTDANQLGQYQQPDADENPFFCLLEDDCLITRASVETDTLLDPVSESSTVNDARVILTITATPYEFSLQGLGFL